MLNGYLWLKFVHVTAAIVWVGAVVVLVLASGRQIRGRDQLAGDLRSHDRYIWRLLVRPAMIVTVLAGIALGHLSGGMQPWAMWGIVVFVASLALLLAFQRRYDRQLAGLDGNAHADEERAAILRRRLVHVGILNILLLLSAVWAMVYKPTF